MGDIILFRWRENLKKIMSSILIAVIETRLGHLEHKRNGLEGCRASSVGKGYEATLGNEESHAAS